MLPKKVETYLLSALAGAPDLFDYLMQGLTESEADLRPDAERFTLREAITHVADWETVFRERLQQTLETELPTLQGYDEGQWAIDRDYAHADYWQQLRLFREGRFQTVSLLRRLVPAQWQRVGDHTEAGEITVEAQAVLIAAHDAYHLQQIAAWRAAFQKI